MGRLCQRCHGWFSRRLFHRRFRGSFSHRGRRRFGCGLGRRRGGERSAYFIALLLIIKGDELSHDESRGPIDDGFIPKLVLAVDGLRKHPHLSALFEGSEFLPLPAGGITELDLGGVCFAPEVHGHVYRGQGDFSAFRLSRDLYAKRFQFFCVQRGGHRLFDEGLIVLELDLVPLALIITDQNAQGHDHFLLHHLPDNIGCISGGGAGCGAYIHIILIGMHIYVFNRGALPDRAFRLGAGLGLNGFLQPVKEDDLRRRDRSILPELRLPALRADQLIGFVDVFRRADGIEAELAEGHLGCLCDIFTGFRLIAQDELGGLPGEQEDNFRRVLVPLGIDGSRLAALGVRELIDILIDLPQVHIDNGLFTLYDLGVDLIDDVAILVLIEYVDKVHKGGSRRGGFHRLARGTLIDKGDTMLIRSIHGDADILRAFAHHAIPLNGLRLD